MDNRILSLKDVPAGLLAPDQNSWQVELSDPARSTMTDFRERNMVTVASSAQIDTALDMMKHAHTRSAFVLQSDRSTICGFVTAYDISGSKPMLHMQSVGCTYLTCSRDDITVGDVMEPVEKLKVLDMSDVESATVRDILDTLSAVGRTHLVVVESVAGQPPRLRGAFSAAKLLRLSEGSRKRMGDTRPPQ